MRLGFNLAPLLAVIALAVLCVPPAEAAGPPGESVEIMAREAPDLRSSTVEQIRQQLKVPAHPGSTCRLYYDYTSEYGVLRADSWLISNGGSLYRLEEVRQMKSRHPHRYALTCTRAHPDDYDGGATYQIVWYPRSRTRA